MFVCIISYFLMDDCSDLDKCRVLPWWLCNLFIYNLSSAIREQRRQQEPCKHCPSIWSSLKAGMMKVPSKAEPTPLSNPKCERLLYI